MVVAYLAPEIDSIAPNPIIIPVQATLLYARNNEGEEQPQAPVFAGAELQTPTLLPNAPNPFDNMTRLRYWLPGEGCYVRLEVRDVYGKLITVLVDERKGGGLHTVEWDTSRLPSGTYYARLVSIGKDRQLVNTTKTMNLIR